MKFQLPKIHWPWDKTLGDRMQTAGSTMHSDVQTKELCQEGMRAITAEIRGFFWDTKIKRETHGFVKGVDGKWRNQDPITIADTSVIEKHGLGPRHLAMYETDEKKDQGPVVNVGSLATKYDVKMVHGVARKNSELFFTKPMADYFEMLFTELQKQGVKIEELRMIRNRNNGDRFPTWKVVVTTMDR